MHGPMSSIQGQDSILLDLFFAGSLGLCPKGPTSSPQIQKEEVEKHLEFQPLVAET